MASPPLVLISRGGWGAEEPGGRFTRHRIERVTVHQSGHVVRSQRESPANLRAYQADHLSRGWPDIAYHLLIDRGGNVYEGRPAWARGDTATDYDPTGHLLVMCDGAFGSQRPSEPQLRALMDVLAWSRVRYGLPPHRIGTHRDHAGARCPGRLLYRLFEDGFVRSAVRNRVRAGTIRLLRLDGSAAARRVSAIERRQA